MEKYDLMEGNRLIAEFMGATVCEQYPADQSELFDFGKKGSPKANGDRYVSTFSLAYRDSWDWLMPVVEKIEQMIEFERKPPIKFCTLNYFYISIGKIIFISDKDETIRITPSQTLPRINRCWICCVEFIKWYNANKK